MNNFIGVIICIVLTLSLGTSLNGNGDASVKGAMGSLFSISAGQITDLKDSID